MTHLDWYETLYPQIDTLEIQTDQIILHQDQSPESELLFSDQAVPAQANPLSIDSLEVHPDLPIGEVIPTLDAVDWVNRHVDIRPRLVDSSTGEARLVDTGAQLSAAKKRPEDQVDMSVNLVAVNGSRIPTYGTRDLVIKIGRKTYKISAVICDVKQDILGFDFMNHYKLNFEWDDWDQSELFLVDKKA